MEKNWKRSAKVFGDKLTFDDSASCSFLSHEDTFGKGKRCYGKLKCHTLNATL
jgi:hypothetical protein